MGFWLMQGMFLLLRKRVCVRECVWETEEMTEMQKPKKKKQEWEWESENDIKRGNRNLQTQMLMVIHGAEMELRNEHIAYLS